MTRLIHVVSSDDKRVVVRVYCNAGVDEYVARLIVDGVLLVACDYFTDSKQDVMDTAVSMLDEAKKKLVMPVRL